MKGLSCFRKKSSLSLIYAILLCFLLLPFNVFATTIFDPYNGTDEYSVSGAGTALDPYVIDISGTNNRITAKGLDMMKEKTPEAIWSVQHSVYGKKDYNLHFSTTIRDVVKAPLMLDVKVWQEQEGLLNLEIGEKDSSYMPATLSLDVRDYVGFDDGVIVTIRGKTNLRTKVKDHHIEFAIENGGDHLLIAEGYEMPIEKIEALCTFASEEEAKVWDKPNEKGEAVAQEYTRAGTPELPFNVELSSVQSSVVDGEAFNEMKNSGQSRYFLWKDENDTVLWSYLAEGRRMAAIDSSEEFDLAISTKNNEGTVIADFAHKGAFPGKLKVSMYVGDYFSNASIVHISGEDVDTTAVVDRGYISFWVTKGDLYTIVDNGEDVSSASVDEAKAVSEETRDNKYTRFKYKGKGYGTVDEPLTLLGKLDDNFHASWKSMNTISGYAATFTPTESSYDGTKLMKVMVEYRSPVTGKLISSLYIDGSEWRMTPENMKGPYYLDYKLNPNPAVIDGILDTHSLYTGKYTERKKGALETLTHYSESKDTVLFLMSRTRSFAGVIHYKIDVSNYFNPGDLIDIKYILGSCNGDLYHGEAPNNAELLLEEASYSKYDTQTVVDASGYISFPLYTGGFFTFSKNGETEEKKDSFVFSKKSNGTEKDDGVDGSEENVEAMKDELKTIEEMIKEPVEDSTHTETGTLVQTSNSNLKEINFTAQSQDGKVCANGYLLNPEVSMDVANDTEKLMDKSFHLPKDSKALSQYNITLKKKSGFTYHMNENDYLDITLCLGSDYSIYDENLLYVKCIGSDGQLTNEFFSSHGELKADGNMYVTFRTTHLSSFVVLRMAEEDNLTAAIALKQEYTSEATTALAEQSLNKEDENKTMKMILIATFMVLFIIVIITDLRRRRSKRGE
ncbi:MAG: hypothetical protein N4A62_12615 [Marinisporobacter sp.]|jgi:hypothetical protein|nr:hypothetical protein [Marinisporobacter sp.]